MTINNKEKKIKSTIEEITGIKFNHQDSYNANNKIYSISKIII